METAIQRAAELITEADALLITAGAGMGVDSGLPVFRGNEGFCKAYPPYRKLGRSFVEMANPVGFGRDAALAWGFYGHRLNLYRATEPHDGFQTLSQWGRSRPMGGAVMTSNVDGHFQRAGFESEIVYEVHGSIHHLQCSRPCSEQIWSGDDIQIQVDTNTMRSDDPLPHCLNCDAVARPNILMFGDWDYIGNRNDKQRCRLDAWLKERADSRVVVVELGAGKAVPTVRLFSEAVCRQNPNASLVRVNPRDSDVPRAKDVSLPMGAREAIQTIDQSGLVEWQ